MKINEIIKGQYFITGVMIAISYYFIDAMMMAFYFEEGSLMKNIIHPTPDDIWMRSSISVILIVLGVVVQERMLVQLNSKQRLDVLNAELSKERDRADAANKAKSDFLASMSHDLRTPLNAILGFSDVMGKEIFGPIKNEKYAGYVVDIHNSGAYLLQLVNDILDISRLEARENLLVKEDIRFEEIALECQSLLKSLIEGKSLAFQVKVSEDLPDIYADRQALKQILINLISNAIKFTPPGGIVKLSACLADGCHSIEIKDNGMGIPQAALDTITNPFVRVDNNPETAHEGAGLGLAIIKSLVGFHYGTLGIKSSVGEGTTVTITLPMKSN